MLRLGEICALGWTFRLLGVIGFIDFILLWCGLETAPPLFPAPLPPPRNAHPTARCLWGPRLRGGGVHVETAPPLFPAPCPLPASGAGELAAHPDRHCLLKQFVPN